MLPCPLLAGWSSPADAFTLSWGFLHPSMQRWGGRRRRSGGKKEGTIYQWSGDGPVSAKGIGALASRGSVGSRHSITLE